MDLQGYSRWHLEFLFLAEAQRVSGCGLRFKSMTAGLLGFWRTASCSQQAHDVTLGQAADDCLAVTMRQGCTGEGCARGDGCAPSSRCLCDTPS